jgi:hypothetical protein
MAGFRRVVQFAGRLIVAHTVDLVVGEPERLVLRAKIHAHRVADAPGVDLSVLAVAVHADDSASAPLLEAIELFGRRHVKRLAQCDVELVIRADTTSARGVVIAFVFLRDQFALRYDRHCHHIRAFVKEFSRGIHQHAVLFDNEQKAIFRETGAVRNNEIDGRRKRLNLSSATPDFERSVTA